MARKAAANHDLLLIRKRLDLSIHTLRQVKALHKLYGIKLIISLFRRCVPILFLWAFGAYFTYAHDGSMQSLTAADEKPNSRAQGISSDGRVIIGRAWINQSNPNANRWLLVGTEVSAGNFQFKNLGILAGGSFSAAFAVNEDGSVVVGESGSSDGERAFRWSEETGMVSLGTLSGDSTSIALGVNADGSVVVGRSQNLSSGSNAFRWVKGSTHGDSSNPQMHYLGTLDGASAFIGSEATDVNDDGSIVVGLSSSSDGIRAFRWVEGGTEGDPGNPQMKNLGTLSGGDSSNAIAVNADGSVVVGQSGSSYGNRAFRWVEGGTMGDPGNPQMKNLGTLSGGGFSIAHAVNADGTVVVGQSGSSDGNRAFRWTEETGMVSLGTLSGDNESDALGVNADGTIVVGFSSGGSVSRAFIWRDQMEDFTQLITSFPVLANDSAVVFAEQQLLTNRLMQQPQLASVNQSVLVAEIGHRHAHENSNLVGQRTTIIGSLSYLWGVSDRLSLGFTLGLDQTSLSHNEYVMEQGFGLASRLRYSDGGSYRNGVQLSTALGYTRAAAEIFRGRLLNDVLPASGSALVDSFSVQTQAGYGFEMGAWLFTPSLSLTHSETRRSAYQEQGAQFNAIYYQTRVERTVATASITTELALSRNGMALLELGSDYEFRVSPLSLTGSSDIPGLESFNVSSGIVSNRSRIFGMLGYTQKIGDLASVTGRAKLSETVFGSASVLDINLSYGLRF